MTWTTRQMCEICSHALPEDPLEPCLCVNRQSPEFYQGEGVIVRKGDYCVSSVGEMKIIMTDPSDPEHNIVLRTTSDLWRQGIRTDADFNERCLDEENFYLDNTPWFEVWKDDGSDTFSDPIYDLDEAVALAIQWAEERK